MKINPNIFRSYDVRGVYPKELDEKAAYKIGEALTRLSRAKKVAVAMDARLSSPTLAKALMEGINSQGADAYDLGLAPTEFLYFGAGKYDFDAGVMVTASHNPKEYNGFKMVKKRGVFIDVVSGRELAEMIVKDQIRKPQVAGKIEKKDIWPDFLSHVLSFVDPKKIKPLKVVIDASSGAGGKAVSQVLPKLPIQAFPLNFEPDGNFPSHSSNPLAPGATDQIKAEIIKSRADCGFIFDGDGDRVFLVNELGELIKGDTALLLLARHFLQKFPGRAVAFNAVCSRAVPEFIEKWGGKPVKTKVGFINVREGLMKENGVVSGEVSGHFSFKGNYYLDSGLIAFLIFLEIISQESKKVSELTSSLMLYSKSDEVNFKVKDKEAILKLLQKEYAGGKQDELDGLTVEYQDWWFNARPSQTEPLLRLVVEAENKGLMEQKKKELISLVSSHSR